MFCSLQYASKYAFVPRTLDVHWHLPIQEAVHQNLQMLHVIARDACEH